MGTFTVDSSDGSKGKPGDIYFQAVRGRGGQDWKPGILKTNELACEPLLGPLAA